MEFFRKFWAWVYSFFCKKREGCIEESLKKQAPIPVSTIDGQNNFVDILAWFKARDATDPNDEFFVADFRGLNEMLGNALSTNISLSKPFALLVGVLRKKDESVEAEVFQCDALDSETKEVLGDDKIVVID